MPNAGKATIVPYYNGMPFVLAQPEAVFYVLTAVAREREATHLSSRNTLLRVVAHDQFVSDYEPIMTAMRSLNCAPHHTATCRT